MFHEIKRPFKVIREQVLGKLNVFSTFNSMRNSYEQEVGSVSTRPAVSSNVSQEEFTKRYKGLVRYQMILIFFWAYTLLFVVFSLNVLSLIVSLMIFGMFGIFYTLSVFKAWKARFVFANWESRDKPVLLTFSDFMNALSLHKRLALPVFNINRYGDL